MDLNDQQIVEQYQKSGNCVYLEELFNKYFNLVLNIAYGQTKRYDLAEDISQEVFVLLYHKINEFDHKVYLKSWFYKVTKFIASNQLKKDHVRAIFEKKVRLLDHSLENPRNEFQEELFEALKILKDKEREIIFMRYYDEYSWDKISQLLNKKPDALRVQCKRALKKMEDYYVKKGLVFSSSSLSCFHMLPSKNIPKVIFENISKKMFDSVGLKTFNHVSTNQSFYQNIMTHLSTIIHAHPIISVATLAYTIGLSSQVTGITNALSPGNQVEKNSSFSELKNVREVDASQKSTGTLEEVRDQVRTMSVEDIRASLQKLINIKFDKEIELRMVFQMLEELTGIKFEYDLNIGQMELRNEINFENLPFKYVLDFILRDNGLKMRIAESSIIILRE